MVDMKKGNSSRISPAEAYALSKTIYYAAQQLVRAAFNSAAINKDPNQAHRIISYELYRDEAVEVALSVLEDLRVTGRDLEKSSRAGYFLRKAVEEHGRD